MFASISDVMAWANCTQDVPAGKYCKTAGTKPDCPVGCYCTGSKHAVGTSINVAKSCQERTHQTELNASGIFFCPEGMTSIEGSYSVNGCYTIGTAGMLGTKPCVPGCFCVNNGQMSHDVYGARCGLSQSQSIISMHNTWYFKAGESRGILTCNRNMNANYYVDEFSELYKGDYGMYGIKGGELIVMPFGGQGYGGGFPEMMGVYQCPSSYPSSDAGAKTVYECYKYDANGNKVYYGANTNIVCAEGTYLPANATQCIACNASQNQVCPGGRFEKSDVIQGLKLNCGAGKYLPANATQCSVCDESQYFCFGGIYDYNFTEDQGLIAHNGYVNMGAIHTFITCDPGKYVPANTNQCSACTGDYICPGGIFFTDATYNVDRGKKLCPYGQPNATHTECVGKSTKPSYAREHFQAIEFASGMKEKIGSKETTGGVKVREQEVVNIAEKETSKNMEQKQMLKQKINDAKLVMPSENRSVSQRPESIRMTETGTVNKKTFIHRAAKTMQKIPVLEQVENVRDRPERKRPSRYK